MLRLTVADVEQMRKLYEGASPRNKAVAQRRAAALRAVAVLVAEGHLRMSAICAVAAQLNRDGVRGASVPSIFRWAKAVKGFRECDWPAALLPKYWGSAKKIPAPVRENVTALVAAGHTMRAAGLAHGIHPSSAARIAYEAGQPRRQPTPRRPSVTAPVRQSILADLSAGHTRTATAARYDVSRSAVQRCARKAGLTRPYVTATKSAH
jgi:hypothetical protein